MRSVQVVTFLHGALHHGPHVLALLVDAALHAEEDLHPGLLDEAAAAQHAVLHVLPGQHALLRSLARLQGLVLDIEYSFIYIISNI